MAEVYPQAAILAAREAQDRVEIEAAAHRVLLVWRAVAAYHTVTGQYARSLHLVRDRYGRGIRDWVVYTDDPNAMQIEYGHWLKVDSDHDGTATPTGKYVPGLRIGNRAFDILKVTGGV